MTKVLWDNPQMYHTDKVNRERFGQNYFLIVEEIVKLLNSFYNEVK